MSYDRIRFTRTRDTERRVYNGRRYSISREIELRAEQDHACAACGAKGPLRSWYGDEKTAQALLCTSCSRLVHQGVDRLEEQAAEAAGRAAQLAALVEWCRERSRAQ